MADIVVAKDVAGTNNHEERAGLSVMRRYRYWRWWADAKRKTHFQVIPNCGNANWNESKKLSCAGSKRRALCVHVKD
jgi:hypothetical protein